MHKLAALGLVVVAVAFLIATNATGGTSEPRVVGPTAATVATAPPAGAAGEEGASVTEPAKPAETAETAKPAEPAKPAKPAEPVEPPEPTGRGPFAVADGIALHPVSDAVVVTGYHEASRSTRAVPLEPRAAAGRAATRAAGADDLVVAEPSALILPSRGRGTAATSAVDLAVPAGEPIVSPVDGLVASVEPYRLYGRSDDLMVTIAPDGRDDVVAAVLHIDGVRVRPGQPVAAGETVIATTARVLPFRSQIERYSGAMPHIHLDVRPARPAVA